MASGSSGADRVVSRAPGVVWRLGPDRVLVRRIGDRSSTGHADLHGLGAMLWIAADEPRRDDDLVDELVREAEGADGTTVEAALAMLVSSGWLVREGA